jgi:hypothetical protein
LRVGTSMVLDAARVEGGGHPPGRVRCTPSAFATQAPRRFDGF